MKGYFSIKLDYCTEELFFGNLNQDISGLGHLYDYIEGGMFDRLVAHDVVEHAVSHRTKTYVTFEEEIRAIGAAEVTRLGNIYNIFSDVLYQTSYLNREISPVPYIVGKHLLEKCHVSSDLMKYLIKEGVKPSCARNAAYQFAWGNYQKLHQFKGNYYLAERAFRFISDNTSALIYALQDESGYCTGVSAYFDTEKHVFRHQMIRR